MFELVFAAMILFGAGAYLGVEKGKKEVPTIEVQRRPDAWTAGEHQEMIKVCAIACGEDRFGGYNMLYGRCSCEPKK